MNGPTVLALVAVIATLITAALLIGLGDADRIVEQWEWEMERRRDEASMRQQRARNEALSTRPRSLP